MSTEFDFIKRILTDTQPAPDVVLANGDDAAVVRSGDELLAFSVDTVVEGTHFSFGYSSPYQVGIKAIESSFSDIVAVGATPAFTLISITLPKGCSHTLADQIYVGVKQALSRLGAILIGGDTTVGGDSLAISVTAIGRYPANRTPVTRSDAKAGDLIVVSGALGDSAAGLFALQHGITDYPQLIEKHLQPTCRLDLVDTISRDAHAAIDISDGLSSELHHLCNSSQVGCVIDEELIPLSPELRSLAASSEQDPYQWAWNGGEDYQILYTIAPHLERQAVGTVIGSITAEQTRFIRRSGKTQPLVARGFDHFRHG